MTDETRISHLEEQLNHFDAAVRAEALDELQQLAASGRISFPVERPFANLHCHSFFSFNAYGLSPTGLAWLGKKNGYMAMGVVDFDVLDAVDEFLSASARLGLRGTAGIETRVFIPEFAEDEINSPGEPGVCYHMGIGFTGSQVPQAVKPVFEDLGSRAAQRNRAMVERLNNYLQPVRVDYDRDVLPLTPSGNATERHMLVAYAQASERNVPNTAAFWSEKLGLPLEKVQALLPDRPTLYNAIRSKLMKRGGVGYAQPDAGSFPSVETLHALVTACGAIPCAAWLDGFSSGEQRMEELLELLISKGIAAFNIIPDRNWNFADPELQQAKVKNLYEVVALAQKLHLPLNVGTEMNSYGQKLVDDFDHPLLEPVREAFLDGAYFVYGHTALQQAAGLGYQSDWAAAYLPTRQARSQFFTKSGRLIPTGTAGQNCLAQISANMDPNQILELLSHK
jgi:hypothetical protein